MCKQLSTKFCYKSTMPLLSESLLHAKLSEHSHAIIPEVLASMISPLPPQTSVDSVEALLKKHEDFESTSVAHDERVRALSEQANKLIHAGHYDATKYVFFNYTH